MTYVEGMKRATVFLLILLAGLLPGGACAEGGIQWYGTWRAGYAEAVRTGRPILLISAAPHCHEVPGIW